MTTLAPTYVCHLEGQKIIFKEYGELSLKDWHKKHTRLHPSMTFTTLYLLQHLKVCFPATKGIYCTITYLFWHSW